MSDRELADRRRALREDRAIAEGVRVLRQHVEEGVGQGQDGPIPLQPGEDGLLGDVVSAESQLEGRGLGRFGLSGRVRTPRAGAACSIRIVITGGSSRGLGTRSGSRNSLVWRPSMWARNAWTAWRSALSCRGEVSSQPAALLGELEDVAAGLDLDPGHGGRHDLGDLLAPQRSRALGDLRECPGVDHHDVVLSALADVDALRLVGDRLADVQDEGLLIACGSSARR